jgi:hypothetical protein
MVLFVCLQFWSLMVPRQVSTTWATPPAFFALVVFQVGSHIFCVSWPGLQFSYLYLLHS